MPDIAIVVGTYGAVPYVHLQLESWRRFAGECPLIVHDDCSPQAETLRGLCQNYGAEFYSAPKRFSKVRTDGFVVWYNGDHHCWPIGAEFASRHGCEWLVKISRRYLLILPWLEQFRALIAKDAFPAWSGWDEDNGYGFVLWLAALNVRRLSRAITEIAAFVQDDRNDHPERFVHDCIRRATDFDRPSYSGSRNCVGHWPLATCERAFRHPPDRLCHHYRENRCYAAVARAWGPDYDENDFAIGSGQ